MLSQKTIACLVYIENDGDLLILNRENPPHAGSYISPGGKVEKYERPIAAAEREVMEETGIKINNPRLVGMLTETSSSDYNWLTYVYQTEVDTREFESSEEGELAWYSWDQVMDLYQPPATKYVSKYVREDEFFAIDAVYEERDEIEMTKVVNDVTGEVLWEE